MIFTWSEVSLTSVLWLVFVGQQTPAELRGPGDRAAAEVENLDFFGTNVGLLLREDGRAGAWSGLSSGESDTDDEATVSAMSCAFLMLLWRS